MNSTTKAPASNKAIFVRTLVPSLLLVAICVLLLLYGQRAIDVYEAGQYHPTAQISQVSDRVMLTARGTELLYASKPVVEDQKLFNDNCESTERTTAMLGCYHRKKIFLFNVQNKELDGAIDVTAAHEMLHAAYDRLNVFERIHINNMVTAEYEKIKNDKDIKQLMEYYSKAEPGATLNELHSIIGTTKSSISPELEQYYGQYFSDRGKVVELNTKYNTVFRQVEAQGAELVKIINQESPLLHSDLDEYNAERSQLETDIASFNARVNSGGFTIRSSFETARAALVERSDDLNARREAINQRVETYNNNIEQLNALSVRIQQLNSSINGITSPKSGV